MRAAIGVQTNTPVPVREDSNQVWLTGESEAHDSGFVWSDDYGRRYNGRGSSWRVNCVFLWFLLAKQNGFLSKYYFNSATKSIRAENFSTAAQTRLEFQPSQSCSKAYLTQTTQAEFRTPYLAQVVM